MNFPSLSRINRHPSRLFSRWQADLDKIVSELSNMESNFDSEFACKCEVLEDDAGFTFKFDMPGVSKKDLKVEIDGNILSVSAERTEEKNDGKKSRYSEISYGSYQRTFTLPESTDASKIDAKFDNGVLTLTLPKNKTSAAKQISVQ